LLTLFTNNNNRYEKKKTVLQRIEVNSSVNDNSSGARKKVALASEWV